jgi:hypothetical protein
VKQNRVHIQVKIDSETEESVLANLSPALGSEPKASVKANQVVGVVRPVKGCLQLVLLIPVCRVAALVVELVRCSDGWQRW